MLLPTATASALPPGYNLYMFGRSIRRVMYDNCQGIGISTDQIPHTVEIIWDTSETSTDFFVYFGNMNRFKCHCSHNRKEFSELLRANNKPNEIIQKFDNEGKYSVYVGDFNFMMSLIMDGSFFKPIEVKLARK